MAMLAMLKILALIIYRAVKYDKFLRNFLQDSKLLIGQIKFDAYIKATKFQQVKSFFQIVQLPVP